MIKELRVQLDGLHKLTLDLKPIEGWGNHNPNPYYENFHSKDRKPDELQFIPAVHIVPDWKWEGIANSKEIETAAEKLIYAKAWLGKCLQEQGVESPYKSGYKTVEDIEPTADVAKIDNTQENYSFTYGAVNFRLWNHVEKVDWLRTEIQKIIDSEYLSSMTYQPKNRLEAIARTNAYNYLCEARFELGWELQRIKEGK